MVTNRLIMHTEVFSTCCEHYTKQTLPRGKCWTYYLTTHGVYSYHWFKTLPTAFLR